MGDWLSEAVGGLVNLFGGDGGSWMPDAYSFGVDPLSFDDVGAASVSPDWAMGGGYSLDGASPSGADLMQQVAMRDPSAIGTPVSLGVSDFNGDPMRPLMVNAASNFEPLGRLNADGSIDQSGFARTMNAFGGSLGSAGLNQAASSLMDAANGIKPFSGGGGSGGSGGGNVSMPSISSPTAERISAMPVPQMQTGAVPNTPAPSDTFRPMTLDTAPRSADSGGLARIFQELAARQDPFADARPRGR